MIHRAIIFAAFGMLATSIDTHEGAAEPADGQRNLTGGLFVHWGVMEPMTRGGPLPRLVSSSERMRLRGLIGAAVFERESTARSDTRYLGATCSRRNGRSTVPGFDAAQHRLDRQGTTANNSAPQKHLTSASA